MCKHCEDRGHWHTDDNELVPARVLITSGNKAQLVISQAGVECYTQINHCPMCGHRL